MFDHYVDLVEQVMDVSAVKRKTIADNISNYNTPGFKASSVAFEHMFQGVIKDEGKVSLKGTEEKHITSRFNENEVIIEKDYSTQERSDGNNVDLNAEMVEMIKNNYLFDVTIQAVNKEFSLHKLAIGRQ